jgi:hypothetical protein
LGIIRGYRFTKPAAYLLSLVSGIDKAYIENAIVQERAIGQYRPWYHVSEGGGAMTLGWSGIGANITYTENWFADDPNAYNGHGYGQDVTGWLSHLSHEIRHLPQIDREGGLFGYLGEFIKQYTQAGEHNSAPYEQEAEKGSIAFVDFNKFVNKNYGNKALESLLNSDGSQTRQIKTINKWWEAYQETQAEKKKAATSTFLNNFNSNEEGSYEWNGSEWVRKK